MTKSAAAAVLARDWLTLAEATDALGKSQSTIERLVASGDLRSKLEPRSGRKPERVYHAGDVERLVEVPKPGHALVTQPKTMALALPDTLSDSLRTLVGAIVQQTAERKAEAERKSWVPLSEKLWLSLDEAAELSGLARADLLRLIGEGIDGPLRARKSGGWKILRKSLEAFEG